MAPGQPSFRFQRSLSHRRRPRKPPQGQLWRLELWQWALGGTFHHGLEAFSARKLWGVVECWRSFLWGHVGTQVLHVQTMIPILPPKFVSNRLNERSSYFRLNGDPGPTCPNDDSYFATQVCLQQIKWKIIIFSTQRGPRSYMSKRWFLFCHPSLSPTD